MTTQLTNMRGEEFVMRILAGQRGFSGIQLEPNFNLAGCEDFFKMQIYLRENATNLRQFPLILDGSDLTGMIAYGLYWPFVSGKKVKLQRADLREANFREANFRETNLERADLERANLWKADLGVANLVRANLWKANLRGAYLEGANLREAYLAGANLERAYLEGARP